MQQNNENSDSQNEEEKALEEQQNNKELQKLEVFLQGSTTGGAVGSHRRLVLTKTAADLALMMFCIFDIPFRKPVPGFKQAKYISWLIQCVLVIAFQLVELNYVKRDMNYLKWYVANHRTDTNLKNRIYSRLKDLKVEYIIRV